MEVNIIRRIDTSEGIRYCVVGIGPNGRLKPDWVIDRRGTRKSRASVALQLTLSLQTLVEDFLHRADKPNEKMRKYSIL
jgi:hypothetical protein